MYEPLELELCDTEWPLDYIDHERAIVRAIVFDDDGMLYFIRMCRDDMFGTGCFIETAGGGVEEGESPESAIRRELSEELGADVEILCKLGVVRDHYNLIHRRNINHYFLCRAESFGERHLTQEELCNFQLSPMRLRFEEAVCKYKSCTDQKLGRLLCNREFPILMRAGELLFDKKCLKNGT